ncbi:MAG TPA: response regulator transcription factor [Terriglobales bacterium]|jgi:DNA-binding NarL/FixJ family response regulator|nr:response regulator transcription factor [Terriglobales bacterium]
MMPAIRILLVDDHQLIRRNLCNLLATDPEFNVISQASSGFEAVRKAQECQPDVILLDVSIPDLNGLHAAPLIKRTAPDAEILFVTQYDNPFFVRQAFAAGARGFLIKSDAGAELLTAVRTVHLKKRFISRSINKAALNLAPEQPVLPASSD